MTGAVIVALETAGARDLDGELWSLPPLRLVRLGGATFAELHGATREAAIPAFARAGVGLSPTDLVIAPPAALVAAVATTLEPLARSVAAYDVLSVRPVSTADATRTLRRARGLLRRRGGADLARCRAVLHEEERVLAWRRVLWAEPKVLRRGLPGVRPVVFDRRAIDRSAERWTFASEARITRWLTA